MIALLSALLRALVVTAVAFGPLLLVLRHYSWRAVAAGVLALLASLVLVITGLAAGGQAWNPGGSGKEIVVVGTIISGLLSLAALWVARSGRAPDSERTLGSRGNAVTLGLVALAWAIVRYDTVPGAWYFVVHPERLDAHLEAHADYQRATHESAAEARRAAAQADSEAAAQAAAGAEQARRNAKPSVIPPLVLFDTAGNAHTILVDERTDVIALEPVPARMLDSVAHEQYLLTLLNDPRVARRTKGRRVILAVDRRYGVRWFTPRGQEVMFRDDSAAMIIRRPQTFYDPRTGAFDMDAWDWMLNVLGMDPREAWGPYRNNMRRFPPAGSPMPYGDQDVVHRR